MKLCGICGEYAQLVRCHVYPRSMTLEAAGPERQLVSLAAHEAGTRVAWARGGLFDDEIVCADCERRFKRADDYAIEFRKATLALSGRCFFELGSIAFPSFTADAALLHKFALTTLLRCHLSTRHEHSQVSIDGLASKLTSAVLADQETISWGPEVCFIVTTGPLGSMAASPAFRDLPDFPLYELRLPNFTMAIAASDRGLMPGFSHIALKKDQKVTVWRRRRPMEIELEGARHMFAETDERTERMFAKRHNRRRHKS